MIESLSASMMEEAPVEASTRIQERGPVVERFLFVEEFA
jgi:hypothetical protein